MASKSKVIVTEEDFLDVFDRYLSRCDANGFDQLLTDMAKQSGTTRIAIDRRISRMNTRETKTPLWFALAVAHEIGMEITIK